MLAISDRQQDRVTMHAVATMGTDEAVETVNAPAPMLRTLNSSSARSFGSLNAQKLKSEPMSRTLKRYVQHVLIQASVLGVTAAAGLLRSWCVPADDDAQEPKAEPPSEQEDGGDVHATLLIILLLIMLTIAFEKMEHLLEHSLPKHMRTVVSAMLSEFSALGFISMCTFMFSHAGALPAISELLYGDAESLVELFEGVHFALFFASCAYVLCGLVLVLGIVEVERYWRKVRFIKYEV